MRNKGEKNATKIYSNKKSSLHSSLYKIWALALDYRGKYSESIAMSAKTKSTLVEGEKIFNFYEYSAISSWEAVTNTKLYYASGNKKYLYLAEKTLLNTLPIWEKFYAIEHEDNSKSFDDRYSINPYQGLLITYYELYKITHKQVYLYKCYGLSEILKGKGSIEQTAKCFDDNFNNKQVREIIALSKKNNCAIVSYLHTQQPSISAAIVFLKDTAFIVMNNDLKSNNIYLQNYDYLLSLLFNDKKNELKNYAFNLYDSFFQKHRFCAPKKSY